MYDIGTYYEFDNWHIEAEYLYKTYAKTHLMMYMLSTPLSITICLSRKACSGKFHF